MTDEQKQRIAEFRRQGVGYATIANMLPKNTIVSHCRRNQLAGNLTDASVSSKRSSNVLVESPSIFQSPLRGHPAYKLLAEVSAKEYRRTPDKSEQQNS